MLKRYCQLGLVATDQNGTQVILGELYITSQSRRKLNKTILSLKLCFFLTTYMFYYLVLQCSPIFFHKLNYSMARFNKNNHKVLCD